MQIRTQTFIGSSSEGLEIAMAIKANLIEKTDCQIWTEGLFLPGKTYIETLEKLINSMDYAILVASPDDMLEKRDIKGFSMRDNVLLEMGLFMAKLGRERTYLVTPEDKSIHIPSDLLGVTSVGYRSADSSDILIKNLEAPCEKIIKAMLEAEKELTTSMRKVLIKRLLSFANQIQRFIVTIQTTSLKSLVDRNQFETVKSELNAQFENLFQDHMYDLEKLDLVNEGNNLKMKISEAISMIPFPEEMVISSDAVIGGVFDHFLGKKSGIDQVKERYTGLYKRYEDWWNHYGSHISKEIVIIQNTLISIL